MNHKKILKYLPWISGFITIVIMLCVTLGVVNTTTQLKSGTNHNSNIVKNKDIMKIIKSNEIYDSLTYKRLKWEQYKKELSMVWLDYKSNEQIKFKDSIDSKEIYDFCYWLIKQEKEFNDKTIFLNVKYNYDYNKIELDIRWTDLISLINYEDTQVFINKQIISINNV